MICIYLYVFVLFSFFYVIPNHLGLGLAHRFIISYTNVQILVRKLNLETNGSWIDITSLSRPELVKSIILELIRRAEGLDAR